MGFLSTAQVGCYRKDGFLLVKNLFTPAEVEGLREALQRHCLNNTRAVHAFPELAWLWADERLGEIAQQLLGGMAMFFGDSSARCEQLSSATVKGEFLHHDGKGTPENLYSRLHRPLDDVYPVVRFGIYLEDFTRNSGGLKVVPGSHLGDTSHGARISGYFNIPSEPGDLVCFCNRTLHASMAVRLRANPDHALSSHQENLAFAADRNQFLPFPATRSTIFMSYAGIGELADLNIKNRALHNYASGFTEYVLNSSNRSEQIPLRVDMAIVESVVKAYGGDREALTHLRRLSEMHFETSTLFPFLEEDGFRDEMLPALVDRIRSYLAHKKTKISDPHMYTQLRADPFVVA